MFTQSELKAMDDFWKKHSDCYLKHKTSHSSFTIKTGTTGIRYYTTITCDSCGESKNITDYDS